MQKTIFLSWLLCIAISTQSQEKNVLTEAAREAGRQGKMLMVVIRAAGCTQCNSVAATGMKAAQKNIDSNCVVVEQPSFPTQLDFAKGLMFIPDDFFGILFFDKDFNILGSISGSNSSNYYYIQGIQKALARFRNRPDFFKSFKQDYYTNLSKFSSIIQLIDAIRDVGFEVTPSLIDELTQKAPIDSASSISFLQYVVRLAPAVASSARMYVDKNRDNFNMAWYRMPLRERQLINQRINFKSMHKAIVEKNISYANQVAYYVQSTYSNEPEEGQKANAQCMLKYYKGVNDTANYLRSVFNFYDRFYMNVKPEQVNLEDSLTQRKMVKDLPVTAIPPEVLASIPDSLRSRFFSRGRIQFAPRAQFYAQALNEGAWAVYSFSKNPVQLNKALLYSKRALEFYETPEVADTYARLLYKTGNKAEAIIWEQRAIDRRIKQNIPSAEFEKVLELMKKGAIEID